jgi:hypothetical protein
MWYEYLMTFKDYPPLQAPETFNFDMILKSVQSGRASHAGD